MESHTVIPKSANIFEVDNARNMSTMEIVSTFVPTRSFWRLLSTKNHIVCGARGSGKTVLMKMLAHDHLSQFDDPDARKVIAAKSFVGIYVPTKIEWVSGLRNKPWQSEEEAELFFQWRLNLATCARLLVTLRSCLDTYVLEPGERARVELDISSAISQEWSEGAVTCRTLVEVGRHLESVEFRIQSQLARKRVTGNFQGEGVHEGIPFFTELFVPLRRGISIASQQLQLPTETRWLICLDEAEFLDELHHRILNTHLRSHSDNVFFKISTMPYHHKTTATNAGAELNVGQDFEYVYIDRDLIQLNPTGDDAGEEAALTLLEKRAAFHGRDISRATWEWSLGPSPLLDPTPADWQPGSRTMKLLNRYASPELKMRADRLVGTPKFRDQIARKVRGALLLREAVENAFGNRPLSIYSGWRTAIRCSDSNPRQLIRIFNALLLQATNREPDRRLGKISANVQTTQLTRFSQSVLARTMSHPRHGPRIHKLLEMLGEYAREQLHKKPLQTDQVSAIAVDETIPELDWEAIKSAVGIGLLFPGTTPSRGDQMPEKSGVFHLPYVLAPNFRILPRRGKSRSWRNVLTSTPKGPEGAPSATSPRQLGFGLEHENE